MTDGQPLVRRRASDQIFADLQDRIVSGEFPRGERLPTERELASHYGVSANTIREALRGLSLMGLVSVRHGSGAFVTVTTTGLIGNSVGMLLRFERVGLDDVVRLSAVLHGHAAHRAITEATEADLDTLAAAIAEIDPARAAHDLARRIEAFLSAFVACAHDPLLEALCTTLDHIVVVVTATTMAADQTDLADDIAALRPVRTAMLDALRNRDEAELITATNDYHARSAAIIAAHPGLRDIRMSDPQWVPLIAGLLGGAAE